jgi:hypothetical protein
MTIEEMQTEFSIKLTQANSNYDTMSTENRSILEDIKDLQENGSINKENIETYLEQLNQLLN